MYVGPSGECGGDTIVYYYHDTPEERAGTPEERAGTPEERVGILPLTDKSLLTDGIMNPHADMVQIVKSVTDKLKRPATPCCSLETEQLGHMLQILTDKGGGATIEATKNANPRWTMMLQSLPETFSVVSTSEEELVLDLQNLSRNVSGTTIASPFIKGRPTLSLIHI